MSFHVGQKVVCIKDTDWYPRMKQPWQNETLPVKGEVYTIRDIVPNWDRGKTGLRLVEIVNEPAIYEGHLGRRWECCFNISRFRPLITVEDFMKVKIEEKEPS
jgi:hypothetical protein